MFDLAYKALKKAEALGVEYAEVRVQKYSYELIRADNTTLREFSKTFRAGISIRIFHHGSSGFSATNILSDDGIEQMIQQALSSAKATKERLSLVERKPSKGKWISPYIINIDNVSDEEKVKMVLETNKAGFSEPSIKSSITSMGIEKNHRFFIASDGTMLESYVILIGMNHASVAREGNSMERVHDSSSAVAGWEFITKKDWTTFSKEISDLAAKAVNAPLPPAGKLKVVADPDVIGLILHEAFGHASEGDLVGSELSVLKGLANKTVASPFVTIFDDGLVNGGYFIPFDDEGNLKIKTTVVEKGVLKQFLTDRASAFKLGMPVTGNGRAQDFTFPPIVRQTNFYMESGDWKVDELISEAHDGIYLMGRGSGGGQVDPGTGTFTFSVGPSRIIKNGELSDLVRGVVISGSILETLKDVEGVGNDFKIEPSVFGGCGKEDQLARVGLGGPHVLIREITVGGI